MAGASAYSGSVGGPNPFRPVCGLISTLNQLFHLVRFALPLCGADTCGPFDLGLRNPYLIDAVRKFNGIFYGRIRQYRDELVTTKPKEIVGIAHALSDFARKVLKHLIANQMTMRVIDELEVIKIHEQDRQGTLIAICARYLIFKNLTSCIPVKATGKTIMADRMDQILIDSF